MATEQDYPTIQGFAPSWADIKVRIPLYDGDEVKTNDIAAINWSDTVETGKKRGTSGGRVTGSTTGQYDAEASITFYLDGWRRFRRALAAKNKRISLVRFDVIVQHTPPGETDIHTAKLVGCRVLSRSAQETEGADPSKREIPLEVIRVEEDGVSLL
jgi:hypothetical protein